jgi:hypothetical protein
MCPVMPFDHYTKVTRKDALAIKAYLFSVPPIHAPDPESHLQCNIRTAIGSIAVVLQARHVPTGSIASAQQNRGGPAREEGMVLFSVHCRHFVVN